MGLSYAVESDPSHSSAVARQKLDDSILIKIQVGRQQKLTMRQKVT
jgi:hypothetical protein